MNIVFFNEAEDAIYKSTFSVENHHFYFDGRVISSCRKREHHLYRIYKKYHISMYFFEKDHLPFSVQRIKSYFREKNTIFLDNKRTITFQYHIFGNTIFSESFVKKIWSFVEWRFRSHILSIGKYT